MAKPRTNPAVDAYFESLEAWEPELRKLRTIVLGSELTEELKWRQPCYVLDKANVAILGAFKEYAAIGFFKGTLLRDERQLLVAPGKNTQSARYLRFTSVSEITKATPIVRAYIDEAIANERAGLTVDFKEKDELVYPAELKQKFKEVRGLEAAFTALTPGRQRAYVMHFEQPKQSATRTSRIEKWTPKILAGKGMNDR